MPYRTAILLTIAAGAVSAFAYAKTRNLGQKPVAATAVGYELRCEAEDHRGGVTYVQEKSLDGLAEAAAHMQMHGWLTDSHKCAVRAL